MDKFSRYTGLLFFIVLSYKILAQSGVNGELPANRLYPKIAAPTQALVVVDLHDDMLDAQVSVCVLQGIVNRSSTKKIYVTNTYCMDNRGAWNNDSLPGYRNQAQMAGNWLNEVFVNTPKEVLTLDTKISNPGLMAILPKFKSFVKGLIIYDPALEDATIEAATTIAGQTDGLVVSPAVASELKEFNFPVLKDLRELHFKSNISCLQWLKANYFAKANKQVAFTWSHMSTDKKSWGAANKDYVVANRLFTFYLNIEDKEESRQYGYIIKDYPAGTPVMGWTDERFADKPLFLSIFAGTAVVDVPSVIKKFCDELLEQKDGRQYYFVRSMNLAATYRAWKGLPVQ